MLTFRKSKCSVNSSKVCLLLFYSFFKLPVSLEDRIQQRGVSLGLAKCMHALVC